MQLVAGTRLGPYEILSVLGAGGMGEVYRARDTKLAREVALKLLPESFTHDPERLARFRREAQVLAALNHPHIGAIYGLDDAGGQQFLVLELIDGDTLADRVATGPVPIDEALNIAKQIAEALEAAHEKGIIHRDLKPANIALTKDSQVKVLDFGLAKATEPASGRSTDLANSPTLTSPAMMTGVGVILGTAAYMSPEQAKGRPADKRSDVWAFGCVLFEMLTGARAFGGDDVSDTLAAVLRAEPDWHDLPADLLPSVRALVEGCLKKERQQRIGDISTARFVLEHPQVLAAPGASAVGVTPRQSFWRRAMPATVVAIIASAVSIVAVWNLKPSPPRPIARIGLVLPDGQMFTNTNRRLVAMSPDGTRIVYEANLRLYLRALSEREAHPIPGAEFRIGGVGYPAFSPDGQWLAYFAADSTLKRIPIGGGTPVTVTPVGVPSSVIWDDNGITFAESGIGISRVAPTGGRPELLVRVDADESPIGGQLLPDGKTILFAITSVGGGAGIGRWDQARIVLQSLKSNERKTLIEGGSDPRYLPNGYLVYAVGGVLFAAPFDVKRLALKGSTAPAIEGVARASSGSAQFSVSKTGDLLYIVGPASSTESQADVALIDRKGLATQLGLPPGPYQRPRISPDGKRVAIETDDGNGAAIWVYELGSGSAIRRLTLGGHNRFPTWSGDGRHIAFQSDREGDLGIFWQRADGIGTAERLTKPDRGTSHVPESWMPRGDRVLFSVFKDGVFTSFVLSTGTKTAERFDGVRSLNPINAVFAPDGKWVAYTAREPADPSSNPENYTTLFVQPYPPTGTIFQLSKAENAHYPVWSANGKQLFYIPGPSRFAMLNISTQPTFTYSNPVEVPKGGFYESGPVDVRSYDITPDGAHIVGIVGAGRAPGGAPANPRLEIVLNWFEELKAHVPAK